MKPIRNKKQTKEKIIKATEIIFEEKGFQGLTNANITKKAGVNHTLIRKYFGSLEHLIQEFFEQKDLWDFTYNKRISLLSKNTKKANKFDVALFLNNLFAEISKSPEYQKLFLWELSEKSNTTAKTIEKRDSLYGKLFSSLDSDSSFDLQAMLALQIAGLHYLSIQANSKNNTSFHGIDVSTPENRQRIIRSVESIIDVMFG